MPFEKFTETTSEITHRPETSKPAFDFDKRIEPLKNAVEKVEEGFNPDKRIKVDKMELTELPEATKQKLADNGMIKGLINRCTMRQDGIIHMDTKCKQGVDKIIELKNGLKIEGVFPEFKSKFDCVLPDNMLKSSDYVQMKECTRQLQNELKNHPLSRLKYSPRQLEQIKNGNPRIDGLTWHHSEVPGKMQLVDRKTHDAIPHHGGKSIWGGGH